MGRIGLLASQTYTVSPRSGRIERSGGVGAQDQRVALSISQVEADRGCLIKIITIIFRDKSAAQTRMSNVTYTLPFVGSGMASCTKEERKPAPTQLSLIE